jgi:chemotaxis protein MotB
MSAPRRKRPESEEPHENSERWMVSYADMVTLLMCLFIVMFAMSQVDQKKYDQLAAGLSQSFGAPMAVLSSGSSTADEGSGAQPIDIQQQAGIASQDGNTTPKPTTQNAATTAAAAQTAATQADVDHARAVENERIAQSQVADLREAQARLQAALVEAGYSAAARYLIDERGLTVSIVTDKVLFDSAQAELKPAGRGILHALGPTLKSLPNALMIEGHTNQLRLTPGGPYATNWELSTARATDVLRYLSESEGVPESRLAAAGYAAQRPVVPLSNPASLTLNRRVDVVVLSTAPTESNALIPSINAAAERAAANKGK